MLIRTKSNTENYNVLEQQQQQKPKKNYKGKNHLKSHHPEIATVNILANTFPCISIYNLCA